MTVPTPEKPSLFSGANVASLPIGIQEDNLERKNFIISFPKEAFEESTSQGLMQKNCEDLLTVSSSDENLIASTNITLLGVDGGCEVSFIPNANASGSLFIIATSRKNPIDAFAIPITINALNDPPTFGVESVLPSDEDTAGVVKIPLLDDSSDIDCSSIQAVSSNKAMIADGSISFSGTIPNCELIYLPMAHQHGTSDITLSVSDGEFSTTKSITVIVNAVNDAPTISDVTDKQTNEDITLTGVAVTIGDIDSVLQCSNLSATSSNTALIPNANISFTGTAPNCLISLTPLSNQVGSSMITINVSDGSLATPDTFVLTVNPVNDAPVIADIAPVSTAYGIIKSVPVSISDVDSVLNCNSLSASSSSNSTLIPTQNISFSGTAPNCTMTLTGMPNQIGSSNINLTLSDGDVLNPLPGSKSFSLTILPLWTQEAYLKASNAKANDNFGYSSSISGDAVVVGAYNEDSSQILITNGSTASTDNNAPEAGAVYVFRRTGVTWAQEAYLKASNANSLDLFGAAVAISGDTAIVGANQEESNETVITNGTTSSSDNSLAVAGASYIFKRTGSLWAQEAYVKASNTDLSDNFGISVSISGDTAVVGASGEASHATVVTNGTGASQDNSSPGAGASYIFKRTGNLWAQEAFVKASNSDGSDYFGISVSISGDTAVVGASGEASNDKVVTNGTGASQDNSSQGAGASYIFRRNGNLWAQEAYLKASNSEASDFDGSSVTISGDSVAVGAYKEDSSQTTITSGSGSATDNLASESGAGYIYKRTGATWAPESYIKASNAGQNDFFGLSVSLSGNTLIIAAPGETSNQTTITTGSGSSTNDSMNGSGAGYIYKRTGSTWAQESYLKASNANVEDRFGSSVSISGDTAVVGAYFEDSNQTTITNGSVSSSDNSSSTAGAVYVYRSTVRIFDPDLRVSAKTANSITLSWGSNLGSGSQVKIAPAVLGNADPSSCSDPNAITLAAGVTNYTYSGLTPATKYGFRICGFDGSLASQGAVIRENTD